MSVVENIVEETRNLRDIGYYSERDFVCELIFCVRDIIRREVGRCGLGKKVLVDAFLNGKIGFVIVKLTDFRPETCGERAMRGEEPIEGERAKTCEEPMREERALASRRRENSPSEEAGGGDKDAEN